MQNFVNFYVILKKIPRGYSFSSEWFLSYSNPLESLFESGRVARIPENCRSTDAYWRVGSYVYVCTCALTQARYYFLLNVPKLSVYSNQRESAQILWRLDVSPTLCIPIYSSISESIELFVIYSNIRFTQNHRQSLQIVKNYPILSDPFESEEPLEKFKVRYFIN